MHLRQLFLIARPRFWIYLIGPWLVALAAAGVWPGWPALVLLAYLTFPANLLIYGINDVFDHDTDQHNAKKGTYEVLIKDHSVRQLIKVIKLVNIPFIVVLFLLLPVGANWWLGLFLLAGIGYSAPPIRAKTKPFLDALSNVLYAAPGFAAYVALSGNQPPLAIVVAAIAWCAAMHAYSAAPDITADRTAGLKTIATVLKVRPTIALCAVLYITAAVLVLPYVGWFAVFAGLVYLALMARSWHVAHSPLLFKTYTVFPYVNTLLGMGLFFAVWFSR